ncbi:thrombomodulin-like [Scleropages formosus]|uniref:thrombomodulin-like n=1 Tax=Scleropages formosus TaxID=113540 RepID=UPI0010FAA017|nr:thrombomodulin-like [Scleropages formosus]
MLSFFGVFIAAMFLHIEGHAPFASSCFKKNCYMVFKEKTDFQTSLEMCKMNRSTLMSVTPGTSSRVLHQLLLGDKGHFWVQDGRCGGLSSESRERRRETWNKTAKFTKWSRMESLCSPHCFSVSSDTNLRERPCRDEVDGFICENTVNSDSEDSVYGQSASRSSEKPAVRFVRTKRTASGKTTKKTPQCAKETWIGRTQTCTMEHGHCQSQTQNMTLSPTSTCLCPSEKDNQNLVCTCNPGFEMTKGRCQDVNECMLNPCEHMNCTNTPGSYECGCQPGFIPKKEDKNRCEQHCDSMECSPICLGNKTSCYCPTNYILNEDNFVCMDYSVSSGSLLYSVSLLPCAFNLFLGIFF